MIFKLSTSKYFYHKNSAWVKDLKLLGFTFEEVNLPWECGDVSIGNEPTIEIKSLEELMEFRNKFGQLVLEDENRIEIYNDYRE